ncbi:MAG: helicase C-terminal domain-containing protein [Acidobacteriota bacterium]|nr:helicase C-terminal domain-containing protein [Acidobacteriota bacterium]
MTVTIDLARRSIRAGVSDLISDPSQRSIGLSGSGLSRLWIGSELHRRLQADLEATEPGFQSEVPTVLEIDVDGWTVEISGRADGVVFEDGRPVRVDEIKSLHFAVDLHNLYAEERIKRFKRQVSLYALMISEPDSPAVARLILVDIVTQEEQDEEVPWSAASVHAWLRQQIHRLIASETRRTARLEAMREAAERVPFPHSEQRPVQREIGDMVAEVMAEDRHLLLRAPTGCGKTAAVLHPAIRSALGRGQRVFFLTAKTLQQSIAVATANAMQTDLFRSLQLRAKSKMCANTEIICHEEFCPYAKEYGIKLVRSGLLKILLGADEHQDPDRIFESAKEHEVCPFEVSLDLLPEVDLVVCDYNYVFDPTIGLSALAGGDTLRDAVLVIDEAHNLVDRSREYYSPQISSAILDRARRFLETRSNPVFDQLAELVDQLAREVTDRVGESLGDEDPDEGPADLRLDAVSDLRIGFDGAMLSYFLFKREHEMWIVDDPVLEVFFALTRFHRVLALGGDEFVYMALRNGPGGDTLKIFCRDASRFLAEVFEGSASSIAMSATLEPFEFYRDLLGFDAHRTNELYVPSPFPPENRLVLAITDVDTTYRRRAANYDRIAAWIGRLCHPGGNVLTLFPSYAFLEAVHDRLPPMGHAIIAQQPGVTDAGQREILEALSDGDPHLLLAVLGGIFAEGVDYPGDMLSQVIVVSPGLPQYNLERELLKGYYDEFYEHGFAYAYLIPGLTRVVQAAGRLLRSENDRGVITIVGRRFLDPRYVRLLPEEWTLGDPTNLIHDDPEQAVREFFENNSESF